MKTALRTLAAVLAGLLVAFLLVSTVELLSNVVHPLPEDFGGTMEEMCRHVEHYPNWILAIAALLWGATALVSTWIAQRIGNIYSAVIVGLILLAALVLNISMLPYPIWFKIANVLVIPAASVAGGRSARRRTSAGTGQPT